MTDGLCRVTCQCYGKQHYDKSWLGEGRMMKAGENDCSRSGCLGDSRGCGGARRVVGQLRPSASHRFGRRACWGAG